MLPKGLQAQAWSIQPAGHQVQLREDDQARILDRQEQGKTSRHAIEH